MLWYFGKVPGSLVLTAGWRALTVAPGRPFPGALLPLSPEDAVVDRLGRRHQW